MKNEIDVIENRLKPVFNSFVHRFEPRETIGNSPMEVPELEEFISSDPTANYLFSNLTTRSRSFTIGAAYHSLTPSETLFYYTETDYAKKLLLERLFVFGDGGDGSIFAINLNDRKIYHVAVCWGNNLDWKESLLESWDSIDSFIDYVEAEAAANFKD